MGGNGVNMIDKIHLHAKQHQFVHTTSTPPLAVTSLYNR